jgi:hypothetical protein
MSEGDHALAHETIDLGIRGLKVFHRVFAL